MGKFIRSLSFLPCSFHPYDPLWHQAHHSLGPHLLCWEVKGSGSSRLISPYRAVAKNIWFGVKSLEFESRACNLYKLGTIFKLWFSQCKNTWESLLHRLELMHQAQCLASSEHSKYADNNLALCWAPTRCPLLPWIAITPRLLVSLEHPSRCTQWKKIGYIRSSGSDRSSGWISTH